MPGRPTRMTVPFDSGRTPGSRAARNHDVSAQAEVLWKRLRESAGSYSMEAFAFVQEGLRYTVDKITEGDDYCPPEGRHVSGRELCMGLREFAIEQYGLMARTVLNSWNIRRTEDFGRIVFALVEAGILRKSDDDSLEDFTDVFDFNEAFGLHAMELC